MSTSTGPAYVLKEGYTPFDVIRNVKILEDRLNLYWKKELLDQMVNNYYLKIDVNDFKTFYDSLFKQFMQENYTKALKEYINYRETAFGFCEHPETKTIIVRLINFTDDLEEVYKNFDYCGENKEYYNGTDSQLSYLTKKEWDSRKKLWEQIGNLQITHKINPFFDIRTSYNNMADLYKQYYTTDDVKNWRRVFSQLYLMEPQIETQIKNSIFQPITKAMDFVRTGNMKVLEASTLDLNKIREEADKIFNLKTKPFAE